MKKSLLLTSLAVWGWLCASAQTQQKTPIDIDFFAKVKTIGNVKVQGNDIFFTLRQPDLKNDSYTTDLYQLVDGQAVQLTNTGNVSSYELIGDTILFRGKAEKGETMYQYMVKGYGQGREYLRVPYAVRELKLVDRQHFFFTATKKIAQAKPELPAELLAKDADQRYRIFDEAPWWSNGGGDINGNRSLLYYYNNGIITALSDSTENVSGLEISPDHKTLVFTKRPAGTTRTRGNRLFALQTADNSVTEYTLAPEASHGGFQFIDNHPLKLTFNPRNDENPQSNAPLYRLDLATKESSMIYASDPYLVGGGLGTDVKSGGGSKVYFDKLGMTFKTLYIDHTFVARLDSKSGQIVRLTPEGLDIDEFIPYNKGYLCVGSENQGGQEFYFVDAKQNYTRWSDVNTSTFDQYDIVHPTLIQFTNSQGVQLNGYVLPPTHFEAGKKYPTILDIHGGPKTAYGTEFFHEMQYWANKGFAVIFTNPTGGDGRGGEFAKLKGHMGEQDYADIMQFVDVAIEQIDYIDADRLGVTGGSYGGFMTNWIIGHTNRFKAAASQRSIADWTSVHTLSDIGFTFGPSYVAADPWTDHELLWKQSPLAYADKVQTPTLFIHSDEDYRCPLPEGLQMFGALQYHNVPSRIVVFHAENHELSRGGRPLNRIKRLYEITSWMEKYLQKTP